MPELRRTIIKPEPRDETVRRLTAAYHLIGAWIDVERKHEKCCEMVALTVHTKGLATTVITVRDDGKFTNGNGVWRSA